MIRKMATGIVLSLLCGVGVPAALAAESSVSMTAAATPTSSTSTATPQVTSAEGTISSVDLPTNTLKLAGADGKSWTLTLDPAATTVWRGKTVGTLAQLKAGERAEVRYVAKDGKSVVKSVEVESGNQ